MTKKLHIFKEFTKNIVDKGFFHLLSANVFIQLVSFASQLFVAGILSPDDIGRIKIIQTFLSIFSIIGGMGLSSSTLKLCSENRSTKEKQKIFSSAVVFTLISTVFVYLLVLLLNYFNLLSSDKLVKILIPLGLFPLISNSIFILFVSYFQAIKQIKLLSKLTISNKLISIVFIILLAYWLGIKGYYIAYNISFVFMVLVCVKLFLKTKSKKYHIKNYFEELPKHWFYARFSMLSNLFADFSSYIDILLISFLVTNMHDVGYYSFALTMTVAFRLFPSSVQQITSPYFSNLSSQKVEFESIFKRYNRLLYIVVGGTLLLALLLIPPFIHLIFGGKYDNSIQYFNYLAVGWSILQLNQLQSGAIFGMGKINYNVYVSFISFVCNFVIYLIAFYLYGLLGVAISSIATGSINLILTQFYYKKAYREFIETKLTDKDLLQPVD